MELKLLHLVILFIFAFVDITCTNAVGPPKVHVINALTDPSPVHLRITVAKDDDYERNEILKQGESLDLDINRGGDFFGDFRRGEGEGVQSVSVILYFVDRDNRNPQFQDDIYWKVEDDGVSFSYDNNSYGPKDPWR